MSRSHRVPLAAAAAVFVTVATMLIVASAGAREVPPSGDPPIGAALSADDRLALNAVPVDRGENAAPVDPAVDLSDPEAVARAYLAAAHSIEPGDTGRTHLRAAGYAAPGSPPAAVGVVVLDPPPAGSVRTAAVTALELIAADRAGQRRGYRAELGTATGPPAGPLTVGMVVRHVVLALQPDGRWAVTAESSVAPDLSAGED